jgi:hypothetical protein
MRPADPVTRTVHDSGTCADSSLLALPGQCSNFDDGPVVLAEADTLDGGVVLPGFTLPLRDPFGELDRQG